MPQFPTLKTGAIAQYPARVVLSHSAHIVPFLDGSEQRFRNSPSTLRKWQIDLSQLDEQEMSSIESFFVTNQGALGTFAFPDPWTGSVYPTCSIAGDQLDLLYQGPMRGQTRIIIREIRT